MMTGLEILAYEIEQHPERADPVCMRKFGPEYAKADKARACRNRDTIICMSPRCQLANACQHRRQS